MVTLSTCSYKFSANWERYFFFCDVRTYLLLKPLPSNAFSAWISMLHQPLLSSQRWMKSTLHSFLRWNWMMHTMSSLRADTFIKVGRNTSDQNPAIAERIPRPSKEISRFWRNVRANWTVWSLKCFLLANLNQNWTNIVIRSEQEY